MRPIRAPGTAGSTGAFPILLLIVHLVVACGTAMDDQVAEVASGTASEETHLALLLAKDRAAALVYRDSYVAAPTAELWG